MKKPLTYIKQKLIDNNGMVFVEASIVFPVMFFVLFFLMFFGNVFYEKAKIDDLVVEKAIEGADHCADPLLKDIEEQGSVPSLENLKLEPYRYIFGGMSKIEKEISQEVKQSIVGSGQVKFFKGMDPQILTSDNDIAKFNNHVLYSTFSVEISYIIPFPIRFLGEDTAPILKIRSHAEVPVNDTAEFIRNTDMVIDYLDSTKIGETIAGAFQKINEFIQKFAFH